MNNSTSECSSRCESGWTMYLDQSSNYADQFYKADAGIVDKDYRSKVANVKEDEDAAEDLSMMSDASSGPPQFHEDENCFDETRYFGHASSAYEQAKKRGKKKNIKENRGKQQHSYLDDTASSPVLRFSENDIVLSSDEASKEHVLSFSKGFSETQFKGKSAKSQKHFGILHSSVPGKPSSEAASGLQGRKRE